MYRIIFFNNGKIYELHAGKVNPGAMYAFVEIEDLAFGEHTELVVDPSEEKLRDEFDGVKRTYIPMHAVIRIDEVEARGANKITKADGAGKVTPFPVSMPPRE